MITLDGIFSYPVKSCRAVEHESATVTAAGFEHDREWMFVTPDRRFITQRDAPRLALVQPSLGDGTLRLSADGAGEVAVPLDHPGAGTSVVVWDDRCAAFDQGDAVADWISSLLGRELRLVRFDPATPRPSSAAWTGDVRALNRFSDGFPLLVISQGSLDDLNTRLPAPLPMNRFRPNLVLGGLPAYGEDDLHDVVSEGVRLRRVKPCMRCVITTTDQRTGIRGGDEPVATLKSYRWNAQLRGVAFGQNVIVVEGEGVTLRRGQVFTATPA